MQRMDVQLFSVICMIENSGNTNQILTFESENFGMK